MTASFADRDHRAEIVERLYDVAVDPIRLEELLEVWEGRVAPLRDSAVALEDPEIEAHLARATVFLDRYEAAAGRGGQPSVLEEIPRSAAFLADGGAQVAGCNRAAGLAFGALTLFVGLIVVLPVLGHATWHLYRRAVVNPPRRG